LTAQRKEGRIPPEIIEFFNGPGGHSLIVKGAAGTGKTTFALQLTEELGEIGLSHYLSSRVSDESLYNQFAWLRGRLQPASLEMPAKPAGATTKVVRRALDQLVGNIERGEESEEEKKESSGAEVKDGFFDITIGFDLPEVERAYDFIDKQMPTRALVLVDSI